jgi:hypothetical protein
MAAETTEILLLNDSPTQLDQFCSEKGVKQK